MCLDFRNVNTLCTSILVETLYRLGLKTVIICPGSRSTPLTVAFSQHPELESIAIVDERSAAFFALGIAQRTKIPVALVCTSGTAAANFYPAIIEAKYSHIPLLILTADRPPELRECHAGQTIDQLKLYGNYPNWQAELAIPSPDLEILQYWRQIGHQAWTKAILPFPGVVHLNVPFREPLAPIEQPEIKTLQSQIDSQKFFAKIQPPIFYPYPYCEVPSNWKYLDNGLIIVGATQPLDPGDYSNSIAHISRVFQFPIIADALSPLRNYSEDNPYLISTYNSILRNPIWSEKLKPEFILQIGELPTSKVLRDWLATIEPLHWIIDEHPENFDPLHKQAIHYKIPGDRLSIHHQEPPDLSRYCHTWQQLEAYTRRQIDQELAGIEHLFEGKISWVLSQNLPPDTPIFIANSMPVRDLDYFWKPGDRHIQPFFNRGANGIDGTLSTALGIAHCHQSSVLLTGDLALLHDTNGFLLAPKLQGHLTIILINNQGGGIFEMLPISQFEPPFEEFFATPQQVDFAKLCATYAIEYHHLETWGQLATLLNPLPRTGIRLLEIRTQRHLDSQWRQENLGKFTDGYQGPTVN